MTSIRVSGGVAFWAGRQAPVIIGRGGILADKREGDGATPVGTFPLRRVLWRPDRLAQPLTGLPCQAIAADDGWCDDPADPAYNRPVKRPYPASHEAMWREDSLYDLVVVIGHNDDPVVPGLGSAVFLHLARPGGEPTEGCVAFALPDLLALLAVCDSGSVVRIDAG
jgi:L,D-peptidoglycan transpeptidase YkuD (ErfK/YbiS/YcfS/YnhG family)